jgi:hypothetical protein
VPSPKAVSARSRESLPVSAPRSTQPDDSYHDVENTPRVVDKSWPNALAPGYLGYTSYSTVIQEARDSLSMLDGRLEEEEAFRTKPANTPGSISPNIMKLCLIVLQQVPDRETGMALFQPSTATYDAWVHYIAKKIILSLYEPDTFGPFLGKNRSTSQLQEMARRICINTAKPVRDDVAHADDWIAQFSGPNIRWESIGSL